MKHSGVNVLPRELWVVTPPPPIWPIDPFSLNYGMNAFDVSIGRVSVAGRRRKIRLSADKSGHIYWEYSNGLKILNRRQLCSLRSIEMMLKSGEYWKQKWEGGMKKHSMQVGHSSYLSFHYHSSIVARARKGATPIREMSITSDVFDEDNEEKKDPKDQVRPSYLFLSFHSSIVGMGRSHR